ncbi:MAG: radical SAM protein [Planctomycetota bacterium]|nr:MAG: radical SAM protein [Planctomycetota bacterium]
MNIIPHLVTGRPQRVLLVGFQDQDNLGLRYLMSATRAAGHLPEIHTYDTEPASLIARVKSLQPDVIGFSLIFQYMAPSFGQVITALREAGVTAHITMGGHYPSFDYQEVLRRIPGLDSVVRYEGELTLVDLLHHLAAGSDWRSIPGLAGRTADGQVTSSPLREPVADLDALPHPDRASIDYEGSFLPTASILGSRGCPWDCSFCSIRPFYEAQGGPLRRLRKPEAIVAEMIELVERRGVSTFLFQDDDFLATGPRARQWAAQIAGLLQASGHAGSVRFKISCRSDEVHEDNLRQLMAGGLTHVYMGVESGDEIGLSNMNKMLTPAAHLEAGRVLKRLGLSFDFGFMLLDPYSTFDQVLANIRFLEDFVGDGYAVAPFCSMLPYAGTPLRAKLEQEGRLLGTPFDPDYHFLDPKLDFFYDWMLHTFHRRNFTNEGLCHLLRFSLFEARLDRDPNSATAGKALAYLQYITSVCNRQACNTLRAAVSHIQETPLHSLEQDRSHMDGLTALEWRAQARLTREHEAYRRWFDAELPAGRRLRDAGFDKSWTLRTGDREAAGIGAA